MQHQSIVIGITDCSKYLNYQQWLNSEPHVSVVKLGYESNIIEALKQCHAVVLSGGEDVHPRRYDKSEYFTLCGEIDERRDEAEFTVLEYVQKNHLPLLGICRGLQVANVFFGGTLIPDVPTFGKFNHARLATTDRYHSVVVDPYSALSRITGLTSGMVNSAHHQSADRLGKGLIANCVSPDGVVEGIERIDSNAGAFLQLVQWHPERMEDLNNPFSAKIKEAFLDAVRTSAV